MKWSSAVSEKHLLLDAISECGQDVRAGLDGERPDLAIVFVSAHYAPQFDQVSDAIFEQLGECKLIGCSGSGVIGAGKEVEHRPGFALTAARLPDVDLSLFHITTESLPDGDAPPERWQELVNVSPEPDPNFVLLADPFSIRGDELLMGLDYAFPRSVKIGGIASGGSRPGETGLFLQDRVYDSGVVGLALSGNIVVDTVVAQGCRPIGNLMSVTRCNVNILEELDGRSAFEVLREIFEELGPRDKQLAQHSLFMGVVMDELNDDPQMGDFLIRNIVGIDSREGVIAVGERLKEGQTVQFHLRDSETSANDLDLLLTRYVSTNQVHQDSGALLFSCTGRGSGLYGRPDHDTDLFRDKVGKLPLTGFFCNGEFGPVGDSTFLHSYTSSFGVFRPKTLE